MALFHNTYRELALLGLQALEADETFRFENAMALLTPIVKIAVQSLCYVADQQCLVRDNARMRRRSLIRVALLALDLWRNPSARVAPELEEALALLDDVDHFGKPDVMAAREAA